MRHPHLRKTEQVRLFTAEVLGKVSTKITSMSWRVAPKCVGCGDPLDRLPCACMRDAIYWSSRF